MKLYYLILFILFSFITLIFSSCKKDEDVSVSKLQLKRTTNNHPDGLFVVDYQYNQQNQITNFKSRERDTDRFYYNDKGEIYKIERVFISGGVDTYEVIYDNNGYPAKATRTKYYSGIPDSRPDAVYTYTITDGHVSEINFTELYFKGIDQYKIYYEEGNVSKIEAIAKNLYSTPKLVETLTFQYGTKKGEFSNNKMKYLLRPGEFVQYFATKDLLRVESEEPDNSGRITTYEHTYNKQGYPIKSKVYSYYYESNGNQLPGTPSTLTYEYY